LTTLVSVYGRICSLHTRHGSTRITLKNEEGLFEVQHPHCPHLAGLAVGQSIHVAGELRSYGKPGRSGSYILPRYISPDAPDPAHHFETLLSVSLAGGACVTCPHQTDCPFFNEQ